MRKPVNPEAQVDLNEYVSPDRPHGSAVTVNPFSNHVDLLS